MTGRSRARRAVVAGVTGGAVGTLLASAFVVPAVAAGDGNGPRIGAAAVAPAALVLGAEGTRGATVAVDVSDSDGVDTVVVRLVDPTGAVRRTTSAVLTGGSSNAGRWTMPRRALAVSAATGSWRVETTACDIASACTISDVGHFTVRRNAYISVPGASPSRVVSGSRTTVTGRLMVMSGAGRYVALRDTVVSVELRAAGSTSWKRVRSVRTSATGRVAVAVRPLRSGAWRVTYAGSSVFRASAGSETTVDVSAVRSWVFGRSVRGRALRVVRIGDPAAARRVLVVGSLHGNEKAGLKVVRRLRVAAPPPGVAYFLVANLNPDGAAANTRQNARGVDLNRNFPQRWRKNGPRWSTYYPGPRASSEPEVRAAQRLVRAIAPTLTVWYHQHMNLVDPAGGPSAPARAYGKAAGMRVERLVRYHGSASSWQGARWTNRAVFIVELPRRVSAAKASRHARAVRAASAVPR